VQDIATSSPVFVRTTKISQVRPSAAIPTFEEGAGKSATPEAFVPAGSDTVSVKFSREARLLKHADFRRVYEQGRRHFSANLTAFYVVQRGSTGPRIGFTVSKALGGAVDRNRMKRRLREATREAWNEFSSAVDVVVNPKKTVLKAEFLVLVDEMRKALAIVGKHVAAGQANPRAAELVSKERKSKPRAAKDKR
jgi:ribonuclease P protein component